LPHEDDNLNAYPRMTRWFDPRLLCKLLLQVIVGDLFGQYADRRLILAALDRVDSDEIRARADIGLSPGPDGAIWIDYVSDLGDGFDATYAVAYCLAQATLVVEGESLPRGGLLIMGGDEVYPTSSREAYNARLRAPYELAFPNKRGSSHLPVFMVPGNHDWYDGLVAFLAMFCRTKRTSVGNWRTRQRRSYFAIRLAPDWWIWAIDIALTEDMDQPQADYFVAIADGMPEGAKIILCSAEPGWYGAETKEASFRSLDYAAQLARNAKKAFRIVVALSGDTHHYARYTSEFGTQFVTSGGGGAFLHGTHSLKETIRVDWLKARNETLSLAACYPSKGESQKLLAGNFQFPFLNWEFALLLGAIYWPLAYWATVLPQASSWVLAFLILSAGFWGYAKHQEKGKPGSAVALALVQAAAHLLAIWLLTRAFGALNTGVLGPPRSSWSWFLMLGIEIVPLGGLVAGLIFGINLWVTSRFFDLNHNDAFSSMRLDGYRHFLRIRIQGNELRIYPIGLDRVPLRNEWRPAANAGGGSAGSRFTPPESCKPRLIEDPILIDAAQVAEVAAAVKHPAQQTTSPGGSDVTAGVPSPPPSAPT
jgi:hypothetical protein